MDKTRDFRIRAIVAMIAVSAAGIAGMQVFTSIIVRRDPALLLGGIGIIAAISAALFVLAGFLLWRGLAPLAAAAAKAGSGAAFDPRELERARAAARGIPILVIALEVAGFFLGPAIAMLVAAAKSPTPFAEAASSIVLGLAVGFMVAIQAITMIQSILREPVAAIGGRSLGEGSRGSLRTSLMLAAGASILLCGVVMIALMSRAMAVAAADGPAAGNSYLPAAFGMLLVCLLWSGSLFAGIGRSIARRIDLMSGRIRDIGKSGGDMAARVAVVSDDELGRLAYALNGLLDGLGGLVSRIVALAQDVRTGAESLSSSAEHAGQAVAGLEESLGVVRGAAQRQSDTVGGTEAKIARMVESIDTVAAQVSDQASFVEQSSASVSEMAANIAAVSRTAEKADALSRKLSEASKEGGAALTASLSAIGEIEAASKSVREIIGVISRIAAQTNLLAMNAAIEAAHAGDAGRGFAVVADEVRGLAENSSKSAKDIESLIRGMAEKIDRGVGLGASASAAFGRIREGVSETSELVLTIAASMSEQRQGAEEILRSVESLTDATHKIKDLTVEQKEESKAMAEAMGRIVAASGEIFEAIQEETGATQALGRVISVVGAEAGKNRERVAGLEQSVSGFRSAAGAAERSRG